MKTDKNKLNDMFGCQPVIITSEDEDDLFETGEIAQYNEIYPNVIPAKNKEVSEILSIKEYNDDVILARKTFIELIETSKRLLETAMDKAEDEDSAPRDIEVAGNVTNKVIDVIDGLMNLHKTAETQNIGNTVNIQNNIQNTYTTAELIEQLKSE